MKEIVEPIEKYSLNKIDRPKASISKIGIVGCGIVGRTLARIISAQGFDIVFIEVSDEKVDYVFEKLEEEFDKSPAFKWLEKTAGNFGFRMSFPKNNRHGVAYEPWHWCWIPETPDLNL